MLTDKYLSRNMAEKVLNTEVPQDPYDMHRDHLNKLQQNSQTRITKLSMSTFGRIPQLIQKHSASVE